MVVELVALVCAMGEKRGLAQRLSEGEDKHPANLVYDGMLLALLFSALAAAFFWFVPAPLFPSGEYTELDRFIVLAIPGYALTEIVLAAQAYKYDIATTVRARAVDRAVDDLDHGGGVLFPAVRSANPGCMAYLASIYAGLATGLWRPRSYGRPRSWRPHPVYMGRMTMRALPLATADAIEWGTRRVDIFILGLFGPGRGGRLLHRAAGREPATETEDQFRTDPRSGHHQEPEDQELRGNRETDLPVGRDRRRRQASRWRWASRAKR